MKKWNISILVLMFSLMASIAFAASAMTKDTWVVGTESTYPPFEFRTSSNELVGFDIDIVTTIGAKLGKKIEWLDMSFDGLIPAVTTHKIDMIAAGMSNTPARKEKIDFSTPFYHSLSAFFVLPGNEQSDASGFEGKIIATQLGTVQDIYVKSMKDVVGKNYQKSDDCLRELLYGRVDAVLLDGPVGYGYIQSKDFKGKIMMCALTDVTTDLSGMALGMSKGDPEFVAAVDKVLEEMKNNGEIQALRDKWGLDDWSKNIK